jgi:hypothetical protein
MKPSIRERIENYKAGRPSNYSSTKENQRNFPKFLFFFTTFAIFAILYISKQAPQSPITPYTQISYEQIEYSFSIKKISGEGNLLAMLTVKSNAIELKTEFYEKSVGSITLFYNDSPVLKEELGEGIQKLEFKPNEIKLFVKPLDGKILKKFIQDNPQALIPQKKSFLSWEAQYIPFKAKLTIHTLKSIKAIFDFSHKIG